MGWGRLAVERWRGTVRATQSNSGIAQYNMAAVDVRAHSYTCTPLVW